MPGDPYLVPRLHESGSDGVRMLEYISRDDLRSMIDANRRTWTSPKTGNVLHLRPVSIGLMNKIRSDRRGRPSIPTIRVNHGSTSDPHWDEEPNPDDPVYVQAFNDWQTDWGTRQSIYVISAGVDIIVPVEFEEEVRQWDANPTPAELKYYYITALITPEEVDPLCKAILSQTSPTEEGIADANAAFPDARER